MICQRGRALREAEGTLSGHAAGDDLAPVLDHSAAVRAIGTGPAPAAPSRSAGVPEPLASIVDHLDELDEAPEFISTAISPRCSTSTRRGSAGGSPSWAAVHPRASDFGVGSDTTRQIRGYLVACHRPRRKSLGPARKCPSGLAVPGWQVDAKRQADPELGGWHERNTRRDPRPRQPAG